MQSTHLLKKFEHITVCLKAQVLLYRVAAFKAVGHHFKAQITGAQFYTEPSFIFLPHGPYSLFISNAKLIRHRQRPLASEH